MFTQKLKRGIDILVSHHHLEWQRWNKYEAFGDQPLSYSRWRKRFHIWVCKHLLFANLSELFHLRARLHQWNSTSHCLNSTKKKWFILSIYLFMVCFGLIILVDVYTGPFEQIIELIDKHQTIGKFLITDCCMYNFYSVLLSSPLSQIDGLDHFSLILIVALPFLELDGRSQLINHTSQPNSIFLFHRKFYGVDLL